MTNEIILKEDGYQVESTDKSIFFPHAELIQVGCRNCIWDLHSQCQYKEKPKSDICDEMLHFLVDLADKGDNLTAIWEKYHIYKARVQEAVDYKDFQQLEVKIKGLEENAKDEVDFEKLRELRSKRLAAKLWWSKLNAHVIQSMQKVVDRQVKSSGTARIPGIHSSGTINFNIEADKKKLTENKDAEFHKNRM